MQSWLPITLLLIGISFTTGGNDPAERRQAALKLLNDAFREVGELPENSRSHFYEAIAEEHLRLADLQGSIQSANAAEKSGGETHCLKGRILAEKLNSETQTWIAKNKKVGTDTTLHCMAMAYLQKDKAQVAERVAREIKATDVRAITNWYIADYKAKTGDWRQATALLRPVQGKSSKQQTKEFLDAQFSLAMVARDFASAFQMAGTDPLRRSNVFASEAKALANEGKIDDARLKFVSASAELDRLGANEEVDEMKFFIVLYEAQEGLFEDALKHSETLKSQCRLSTARERISILLAEKGHIDRALAVAKGIWLKQESGNHFDSGESQFFEALQMIARVQINSGDPKGALRTLAIADSIGTADDFSIGRIQLERSDALVAAGSYDEAKKQLKVVVSGSYNNDNLKAYSITHEGFCLRHTTYECVNWIDDGYNIRAKISALIGAATGLTSGRQKAPTISYLFCDSPKVF